ncbi:MAG: TonB-dependent receptor family protein [Steroidobacteraceae bacterium]
MAKEVIVALAGVCLAVGGICRRAEAQTSLELAPIVVMATRVAESSADLPASIDRVDRRTIQAGQLQVNLSESLMTVPGVSAESRQNYAQDLQISVRGFGARSSFGVRGVRLYSDGIPGTMPDGQGQFSQFDLGSADHIEVLRGPFSALYGNSSGGVIAVFTEDAKPGYWVDGTAEYGTFNTQRYALKTTGNDGVVDYVLDASHFQTDGYRFHSDAERNLFNGKLKFPMSDAATLTVVVNAIETPFVQDPLGLTQAQLAANPQQAGVGAIAYNTRKTLGQEQLGAVYDNRLSETDDFTSTWYTGHRATTQYQAIPQATEEHAPLYPGGVIDLDRAYWGIDAHVTDRRSLGGAPFQVVGGISYDDLEESRLGFLNYVGSELGVEGAIRRDEANHVYDFDQYLQAQWDPDPRWRVIAGVRNSTVDVSSHDHLPGITDPDSGVRYSAVNPVGGVMFRAASAVNVYASYGKGFETPTLDDLAYRSTNGSLPGLNLALKPARSDNYEVGVKVGSDQLRADLAGFYIKTDDELSVLANTNGRAVEQNIGQTNRRGAELAVDAAWAGGFSARVAYTYIRAVVGQGYYTCTGPPCTPPATPTAVLPPTYVLVRAGSHLPAVPMNALYAGLTWAYAPMGFTATLEAQSRAHIYANDLNSASAAGYWVANVRAGFEQQSTRWRFSEFVSADNLANRAYVGSVIVNESNSRFFEAAPGRTAYIMFNAARRAD